MLKLLLKRIIASNKSLILRESQGMNDFMMLLMKQINTADKWTVEDIKKIKSHLIRFVLYVPVLVIFFLPFGSLLLPLLAEILDKRAVSRKKEADSVSNFIPSIKSAY